MKKTLIVLMMALLAIVLVVSCDDDANGSDTTSRTINITYDLKGGALGEGVTNPSSAKTGETITPTAPTRGGGTSDGVAWSDDYFNYTSADVTTTYTFKGWKIEGSEDSTASDSYTAGTEDVKLVAVWDVKSTVSNVLGIRLRDTVSPGTTITLGKYNGNDITWKVLDVETSNNKALLFASTVVRQSMPNSSETGDSFTYSWGTKSPIYEWFNSNEDTGFISQCNLGKVMFASSGDVGTVFLLSKDEVTTYMPDESSRVCNYSWWLRDKGTSDNICQFVYENGSIFDNYAKANTKSGVRPAFWISLQSSN